MQEIPLITSLFTFITSSYSAHHSCHKRNASQLALELKTTSYRLGATASCQQHGSLFYNQYDPLPNYNISRYRYWSHNITYRQLQHIFFFALKKNYPGKNFIDPFRFTSFSQCQAQTWWVGRTETSTNHIEGADIDQ